MSTARFNTLTDASGGNSMPVADINQGRAKAWNSFNGTGVIAVRDSFNLSSITDLGTGLYRPQLTTSLANANYNVTISPGGTSLVSAARTAEDVSSRLVGGYAFYVLNPTTGVVDCSYASSTVMGDI